jgi:hypothetical protein
MIQLIVDFNPRTGFWYFIVTCDERVVCFRPSFFTREDAELAGNRWIQARYHPVPPPPPADEDDSF